MTVREGPSAATTPGRCAMKIRALGSAHARQPGEAPRAERGDADSDQALAGLPTAAHSARQRSFAAAKARLARSMS